MCYIFKLTEVEKIVEALYNFKSEKYEEVRASKLRMRELQ